MCVKIKKLFERKIREMKDETSIYESRHYISLIFSSLVKSFRDQIVSKVQMQKNKQNIDIRNYSTDENNREEALLVVDDKTTK